MIETYHPCFQHAVQINAAAVKPVADLHRSWLCLSGEGLHIYRTCSRNDNRIHRNPLSRSQNDHLLQLKLLRRYDLDLISHFEIGIFRPDINKL